jgi:hypothetical protein
MGGSSRLYPTCMCIILAPSKYNPPHTSAQKQYSNFFLLLQQQILHIPRSNRRACIPLHCIFISFVSRVFQRAANIQTCPPMAVFGKGESAGISAFVKSATMERPIPGRSERPKIGGQVGYENSASPPHDRTPLIVRIVRLTPWLTQYCPFMPPRSYI